MTATPNGGSMSPDALSALTDSQIAAHYACGALVVAARGEPPAPVFASAAAAAVFGVRDLEALARVLFAHGQPGGARLAHLARTTPADAPARLERLRFFLGSRSEVLDFQCRMIGSPAGSVFVATAAPRLANARRDGFHDLFEAVPPAVPAARGPARDHDRARADFDARIAGRKAVRFVWETDAGHLTTKVSAEFGEIVGSHGTVVAGTSLPQSARRLGADPDERLTRALSSRATFTGLELSWPVDALSAAVPVVFCGQPRFDRQRAFLGYRGFGVIRVDRLMDAPAPAPVAEPAAVDSNAESRADHVAQPPGVPIDTSRSPETWDIVSAGAATPERFEPAERRVTPPLPPAHRTNPFSEHVSMTDRAPMEANVLATRSEDHPRSVGEPVFDPADPSETVIDPALVTVRSAATSARPALTTTENDAFDELASLLQARLADDGSSEPQEHHVTIETVRTQPAHKASMPESSANPVESALAADAAADPDKDIAVAMERLPVGVLVARGGIALYANRTLLDLLGHADLDAFHAVGGLDYTLRGRDPGSLADADHGSAISLATADGEILNVDGHLQAINWSGAASTLMSFRRSAEAEIARRVGGLRQELETKENEAVELHAILDTATDGVAVLDKSGIILSLNRSAEALFGLELSDVIGEPFTTLLAPESHGAARDYLDGLKKSGVASVLNDGREVVGRAGRRGVIPLFMTIGHLPQQDGTRFCAVLRDLTPWKRAERDLQEARRAAERASQLKSDFLARVSHEIRTPMNAILGFAEVIMEERFGAVGNERYKEYLHDIHSSGVHVMNIVNDLLDLSKIEAGKMELSFASVDANKVVTECVALMQPQAYRERVIIRMALAPRLPNIVADETSLRQIILNVLSNAVNFNEAGGQVIVSSALTDGGAAVLRIRDTGIGMSESDLEAALEPFKQLPTARRGTGTGLGLPLTKALADANRASFTIKSKKNEGTLVEIAFPSARVLTP